MIKKILKTEAVKEEIFRQIEARNLEEGDYICTEKNLIELCEVSNVTVKRALAQLKTQGFVFGIPGKGTYVGKKFSSKSKPVSLNKIIELLIPVQMESGHKDPADFFAIMTEVEKGIMAGGGFKLIFNNTHFNVKLEYEALVNAIAGPADAIIFEPANYSNRILEKHIGILASSGKPFIVVSDRSIPFEVDSVFEDDFYGASIATSHLIKHGHEKILHINYAGDFLDSRRKGYKHALMENRIDVDKALIYNGNLKIVDNAFVLDYEDFYHLGYKAVKETLAAGTEFSAIFAINDKTAEGAITALTENGMKIPDDVSIVGYDNRPEAKDLNFSSIQRPFVDIGKTASKMILNKLNGMNIDAVTKIGLKPHLVERNSVKTIQQSEMALQ